MKSICTNQEQRLLVQIGIKIVHKWTMGNPIHKRHHGSNLGSIHHFIYSIFYECWWGLDQRGKKHQG
jgi:hypothetical protein